jgi:hypothetical protein
MTHRSDMARAQIRNNGRWAELPTSLLLASVDLPAEYFHLIYSEPFSYDILKR